MKSQDGNGTVQDDASNEALPERALLQSKRLIFSEPSMLDDSMPSIVLRCENVYF